MRSNALDAVRVLEVEVSELQGAEKDLKLSKDAFNRLQDKVTLLIWWLDINACSVAPLIDDLSE